MAKLPENVASLAIDAQPTFCEGGGLAVEGGNAIMPGINEIRAKTEKGYWTQDWHPPNHCSFASNHKGREPFDKVWIKNGNIVGEISNPDNPGEPPEDGAIVQILWPDHAIQGTQEAELHPDLKIPEDDMIVKKGDNPNIDSYSCVFENDAVTRPAFENGNTVPEQLRKDGIDTVVLSGLALDVCVAYSACDMADEGFRVIVIEDATSAISEEGKRKTLDRFSEKGVETATLDTLKETIYGKAA